MDSVTFRESRACTISSQPSSYGYYITTVGDVPATLDSHEAEPRCVVLTKQRGTASENSCVMAAMLSQQIMTRSILRAHNIQIIPQHVLQDTTITKVLEFIERVDAADE